MNPVAMLWMLAILMAWITVGYEAIHLGAWLFFGLYLLAAFVVTNPRLWLRVGLIDSSDER